MQVLKQEAGDNTSRSLASMRKCVDGVNLLNKFGRISFLNTAGMRTLGVRDVSDVVGREWWTFWPEQEHEKLKMHFHAAEHGEARTFPVLRAAQDGTLQSIEMTMLPVPNEQGMITSVLVEARCLAVAA